MGKEVVYACPPPRKALQVLLKLKEERTRGTVVIPESGLGVARPILDSNCFNWGLQRQRRYKGAGKLRASVETFYDFQYNGYLLVLIFDFR